MIDPVESLIISPGEATLASYASFESIGNAVEDVVCVVGDDQHALVSGWSRAPKLKRKI